MTKGNKIKSRKGKKTKTGKLPNSFGHSPVDGFTIRSCDIKQKLNIGNYSVKN